MLCFAVKALNGRTANVGLPFYFGATAPNQCEALLTIGSEIPIYCSFQAHLRRLSPCRFRHCGEGFGKGNLVSLSSSAEVWNPLQKVRPNKKPCILKC